VLELFAFVFPALVWSIVQVVSFFSFLFFDLAIWDMILIRMEMGLMTDV
jgi:hypothetical protein